MKNTGSLCTHIPVKWWYTNQTIAQNAHERNCMASGRLAFCLVARRAALDGGVM